MRCTTVEPKSKGLYKNVLSTRSVQSTQSSTVVSSGNWLMLISSKTCCLTQSAIIWWMVIRRDQQTLRFTSPSPSPYATVLQMYELRQVDLSTS